MRPHGLKGEVTISLDADSPAMWDEVDNVMIEIKGNLVPYFVESVSVRGNKAFLKLDEVETADAADALKGCALYLPKSSRPDLEEDDFYNDEVIGFNVIDSTLGKLGLVKEIEQAAGVRFLIINYAEKEVMIPAHAPLIQHIDRSTKTIQVDLPEGFLEI